MYLNVVIARHLLLSASVSAWPSAKPEQPTPTLSRLRWRWRWRCRWRTAATQADCKNKTILFYHINIPICQPIRDEQKFSSIMYFLTMKYNLLGKKKKTDIELFSPSDCQCCSVSVGPVWPLRVLLARCHLGSRQPETLQSLCVSQLAWWSLAINTTGIL